MRTVIIIKFSSVILSLMAINASRSAFGSEPNEIDLTSLTSKFDINSLKTGLSCAKTLELAQRLMPGSRHEIRSDQMKGFGSWIRNFEISRLVRSAADGFSERLYVDCSGLGSGNLAISLKREIKYDENRQINTDQFIKSIEEKYGRDGGSIGKNFKYFVYNHQGVRDTFACGEFSNSDRSYSMPSPIFGASRLTTCGFFLMVRAAPGISSDRISDIVFVASDFNLARNSNRKDQDFKIQAKDSYIRNTPLGAQPRL